MEDGPDAAPAPEREEFNERARLRLRIAARFLRQRGCVFPKEGNFYSRVLAELDHQADKDELRGLVDWIESYENAELASASRGGQHVKGAAA
jgi:hypothetical protein